MAETKCKECAFFWEVYIEGFGCCTISGNTHSPEDICEAEKIKGVSLEDAARAWNRRAKDGKAD